MSVGRGVPVVLDGVVKRYAGHTVLDGVSLAVAPGELLAIVGQSGQGKSVLLRLIAGLETPQAGCITVGDLAIADYRARETGTKPFRMAVVFQGAALLGALSLAENVALRLVEDGRPAAEVSAATHRLLDQVELADAAHKRPGELSGGMRKRAAIARALAVEPELILYDEPTADLDPLLTAQIAELIRRIHAERGATQILVTHHLPLAAALADRIAVLHAGRIVEVGPPAAILASRHPFTHAFVCAATFVRDTEAPS